MIIGLSGKAESGKDTVANIIRIIYPNTEILHFGDALKDVASSAFSLERSFLDEQWYKKSKYIPLNITVREILQKVGSLFRQTFYENIWIDTVLNKIDDPNKIYVIADVRYPNEKKAIEDKGGIVIRIDRQGIPQMEHQSETALDDCSFKYTIYNNGTLENLSKKVELLCKQLFDNYDNINYC